MPGPTPRPVIERVWSRIDKRGPRECWPWTGAVNGTTRKGTGGYGHLGEGGKFGRTVFAHVVVYRSLIGAIPDGWQVDHRCKNRLCCNPRHLEAVPPSINNERSDSPTSKNLRKTHCPQGHEYTPENTGYRRGKTWRYCRACARESMAARRAGISYSEWRASL